METNDKKDLLNEEATQQETVEQPKEEKTVVEETIVEETAAEQPVAEDTVVEEPIIEETVVEETPLETSKQPTDPQPKKEGTQIDLDQIGKDLSKMTKKGMESAKVATNSAKVGMNSFADKMNETEIVFNGKKYRLPIAIVFVFAVIDLISLFMPFATLSFMGQSETVTLISQDNGEGYMFIALIVAICFLVYKKKNLGALIVSAFTFFGAVYDKRQIHQAGIKVLQEIGYDNNYTRSFLNEVIKVRAGAKLHVFCTLIILIATIVLFIKDYKMKKAMSPKENVQ